MVEGLGQASIVVVRGGPEGPPVREIWTKATAGTHVRAAAYRARQSASPAEWRVFLETGIFTADAADKR
ncbi:hypothetical protein [Amycolatopsis sp. NBC_01480]|uniref:hypothetical protein n=1 Tax=Amycolatopsis sp. NBC_01480 TaxID=2903562 RepID=UPI002E2DC0A8|nr:hypothetical protein [Amycolatopsis sp. NBC_01480]